MNKKDIANIINNFARKGFEVTAIELVEKHVKHIKEKIKLLF